MWQIFATKVCILSRAGKPAYFVMKPVALFLAPTLVQVKFYRNVRTAANIPLHIVFNPSQMVCMALRWLTSISSALQP